MIRIKVENGRELRNVLKLWAHGRLRRTVAGALDEEARRLQEAARKGHDTARILEISARTPFDVGTVRQVFEGADEAGLRDQDVETFLERCAQARLAPLVVLSEGRARKIQRDAYDFMAHRGPRMEDLELP